MTFQRADILLPKECKNRDFMNKWSVVACDQYTSQRDYWEDVSKFVGDSPSTLKVIVPEIYLNDNDIDDRIKNVNKEMKRYIDESLFTEYKNCFVFVKRILNNGAERLGIIGAVDLEDYDFNKGSKSKIRATEGTVISRIPPRLKVRQDAIIELPHIMLLIDDESKTIIEDNLKFVNEFELLYDFDLIKNSGHITGYKMSEEASGLFLKRLDKLSDIDGFNKKYKVFDTSPLVYAMGDGNHSLATAKTYYENLKKEIGEDAAKKSRARYALCELVNLHDDSLVFEAIHRVVFNTDKDEFIKRLGQVFDIEVNSDCEGQKFKLIYGDTESVITVKNPKEYLTVASVQGFIDSYIKEKDKEVDYIHGEDVVKDLCKRGNNIGIILDAMEKKDLFKSVILDGALPRKTFSMGEARDKRFYVEARKIR